MQRWGLVGLALVIVLAVLAWTISRVEAPARPVAVGAYANTALARNPDIDPGTGLGKRIAPSFTLTNQFGQAVSLRQFRGKVVILAFVDSECTTVCPLTTASMTYALGMLGPKAARQVALVGVDANPHATLVADVRAYSEAHGVLHQWNFLTGTLPRLKRVWRAYGIAVQILQGQIDHTPALYVIDQHGRERWVYLTQMKYAGVLQQAQVLAHAVAALLPGHPRVLSHLSYAWIRGEGPGVPVTLPLEGARGGVALGPGHPHVLVFLASWLRQTSNLTADLQMLNGYQAYAVAHHLPGVVLVDESVTEPSPQALSSVLALVPGGIRYPLAVDESGRLADGYGVTGLPWIAITSRRGQITWHSGQWPSLARLEQAVAGVH
jgi:cytochrome oxidase Cu insertion factor (SCO1/SenC/PrrC family)